MDSKITILSIHARPQFDRHASQIKSRNQWWKKSAIVICYLFLFSSSFQSCSAIEREVSNCTFPKHWEGSWFLSGNQLMPIAIKGDTLGSFGKCTTSDGDKFLTVDGNECHRCFVITERHKNVLQYKRSYCESGGSLDSLCEQIPGAAQLYSLFRENAEPVKCPLTGSLTFTYNQGHGECKEPVSKIESSTDDSKLSLNLQACPDVPGTESRVEELSCLATFRDGFLNYLVGLVSYDHAASYEERYRCFVYEKISSNDKTSNDVVYKLAQSGDATCNGLEDVEFGSRVMTLRQSPSSE